MWFWAAGEKTLSVFLLLRQICLISWIISHFWRFCRNLFKTAWDKESCVSQSYACRIYFFFSGHQGLHLCVNVSPASVNPESCFSTASCCHSLLWGRGILVLLDWREPSVIIRPLIFSFSFFLNGSTRLKVNVKDGNICYLLVNTDSWKWLTTTKVTFSKTSKKMICFPVIYTLAERS